MQDIDLIVKPAQKERPIAALFVLQID